MTVRHAWVAEQVSLGACLSPLTHTHTVRVPSPRCPHQDSPLLVVAAGHGNGNIPMEHTLGEKHRQRPQRLASSPCITMATQNVPTLLVVTAGDGNGNIPAEHIPGELHRRGRSTESQAHAMRWQYSIPKPRWLHVFSDSCRGRERHASGESYSRKHTQAKSSGQASSPRMAMATQSSQLSLTTTSQW